jgi:hypothetical protein
MSVVSFETSVNGLEFLPSIGFARNEHFPLLNLESVHEVLPEAKELFCYVLLACSCWRTLGETRSNWLLNPDNIGKVGPGPGILYRCKRSILP